jgi:hypothetical protein
VGSRQHPQKLQLRTAGTGRLLGNIDSPVGPEDACTNLPTMGDSHPWHVSSQIDLGRRCVAAAILLEAPLREDPKSKERDRWTAPRLTSISMRRRFFAYRNPARMGHESKRPDRLHTPRGPPVHRAPRCRADADRGDGPASAADDGQHRQGFSGSVDAELVHLRP